jgi:DHA2 family multidrug resistance protein
MPKLYLARLRGWRFVLFNGVLGLGHILVLSNVGGYTVTVPHVAGSLGGVYPSFATWATTDFLIGLALGFPIARWLSGRFGDYRLFIAAFVVYALASFLCAISESLWLFLPARIILGFVGGVTLPVGQRLLLNEYPERSRLVGLSIWGVFTVMPFTIGIPLGGWFAEHLGWRYLFYSNIPVALVIAGTAGSLLYGRGFHRRVTRFDAVGYALLALLLFGLQTILNQGNDFDWFASPFLRCVAVAMVVALPCFIFWELGERQPAINIGLFLYRNFAIASVLSMLGFLIIQGLVVALFVGQLQILLGYSSSLAGLIYLFMIPLSAPIVAIAHRLCNDVDARLLVSINFVGLASVLCWIGLFDDPGDFDQILWPMLFMGFFVGAFFAPLGVLALHALPERQLLRAAEELALLRTAAGAFGIALQGVVQFRRTPFHQLDLADHFGGRRFASLDLLHELSIRLESAGLTPEMAQSWLGALIKSRAALLGMNDAFFLASFVFLLMSALVWLARPTHVAYASLKEELREIRAQELMEQP